MASIQELNQRIDLHDLAGKLGLKRPQQTGNYKSPHHADKSPSLSIYASGKRWKDHSEDTGGDALDLVCFIYGVDKSKGVKELHSMYGIPLDKPDKKAPPKRMGTTEFIASRCFGNTKPAVEYLEGRGITKETIQQALSAKSVGYNDWHSDRHPQGQVGFGGPAVAFIVRSLHDNQVVAVDTRYLDPSLNGGVKTQSQGDKTGNPWFLDRARLDRSKTVYIVESSINALSIESANMKFVSAVSTRGTANAKNIDWRFLDGKQVIIAMDADTPGKNNKRPGPEAAWTIYESLTSIGIGAIMVDQSEWYENEWNDVNDVLQAKGMEHFPGIIRKTEPWVIPGLPGQDTPLGVQRVYLPTHDFNVYWRYRSKLDATTFITKVDDAEGTQQLKSDDVCGFRIAGLSKINIASATATMTGELDAQPTTVFNATVQLPRHKAKLVRKVLTDDKLHNVDYWKKFGPVYSAGKFSRLLTILERTVDRGSLDVVNFVGLAWKNGLPIVNEGADCYFVNPTIQCYYHNLVFPTGSTADAKRVIEAYQKTFTHNAAYMTLLWGLGAHLKAFLGYWPHLVIQAGKASGKSTLVGRLERTIAMKMFSSDTIKSSFRLVTSMGHTSHPIGWEEISTNSLKVIDRAVEALQQTYQSASFNYGSDQVPMLSCAPVLLAGEDVPVKSLTGKLVRTSLTDRKGPLLPEDLPKFPVRGWLDYLASMNKDQVIELHKKCERWCQDKSRAPDGDSGAGRMITNYAAVLTAHALLCEFAGIEKGQGGFYESCMQEMNEHIGDTEAEREPFVWILEILLTEIETRNYQLPYTIDNVDGEPCLILRVSHIITHISQSIGLREKWNAMPVKTSAVLHKQITSAGLVVKEKIDRVFATIPSKKMRFTNMTALSIDKMSNYGLHVGLPEDFNELGELES